jgi:hypothetical protein
LRRRDGLRLGVWLRRGDGGRRGRRSWVRRLRGSGLRLRLAPHVHDGLRHRSSPPCLGGRHSRPR